MIDANRQEAKSARKGSSSSKMPRSTVHGMDSEGYTAATVYVPAGKVALVESHSAFFSRRSALATKTPGTVLYLVLDNRDGNFVSCPQVERGPGTLQTQIEYLEAFYRCNQSNPGSSRTQAAF